MESDRDGIINLVNWLLGCIFIFCSLFGVGKLVLLEYQEGIVYLLVAAISVAIIFRNLGRQDRTFQGH